MNAQDHRSFLLALLRELRRIGDDLAHQADWVRGLGPTDPPERGEALHCLLQASSELRAGRGAWLARGAQRAIDEGRFRERSRGFEHECWLDDNVVIAVLRVAHPFQGWLHVVLNPPERSGDAAVCSPVYWIRTDITRDLIPQVANQVAPWLALQILNLDGDNR